MPSPAVPADLESIVDLALVKIVSLEDRTLGTGFLTSPDGQVLTCHHVVADHPRVRLVLSDGETIEVEPRLDEALAALDLAVLQAGGTGRRALPLMRDDPGGLTRFWSKGFQFQGRGLTASVPVRGEVTGHTRAAYARGSYRYDPPVLVLNVGDLDEGLSGAPLLDPASGAVFGVVVAYLPESRDIRGFALSLPDAATRHPGVQRILDDNDATCPRFGRAVNRLGAGRISQTQVARTTARLESEGLYLPRRYCERPGLDTVVAGFASSNRRLLPLVGPAGMGKTTFLARLASSLAVDHPVLFARGLDITAGHTSVERVAAQALAAGIDEWPGPPAVTDLAVAARRGGNGLWILLDGLNEHRCPARDIADVWMPTTLEWLRRHDVRLVMTCRDELWDLLSGRIPDDLVYKPLDGSSDAGAKSRSPGVRVGVFSKDEVAAATDAYDMSGVEGEALFRHPLALRLAWQLRSREPETGSTRRRPFVDIGTVIDELVAEVSNRVALSLDTRPSPGRVQRLIDDVAAHLFTARAKEVPFGMVRATFGDVEEWLDALAREHLFAVSGTGYRFAFDEVDEYLQAANVPLDVLSDPESFSRVRGDGAVPWAVLEMAYGRLAAQGRTRELAEAVSSLSQWIRSSTEQTHWAVSCGFDVIRRVAGHPESTPLIREILLACRSSSVHIAHALFPQLQQQLALPVSDALEMVRILLPGESWRGWREKDWRDERRRRSRHAVWTDEYSLAFVVADAIERDPTTTLAILLGWLDDETKLDGTRSSEATIGDFALACLFYGRSAWLLPLCEGAAQRTADWRIATLLRTLVETDGYDLIEVVEGWAGRPTREQASLIVLSTALRAMSDDTLRTRVIDGLARLMDAAASPAVKATAASVLGGVGAARDRAWTILFTAVKARTGDPGALAPYLAERWDEVQPVFQEIVAQATHDDWAEGPASAQSVLTTLAKSATSPPQILAFVHVIDIAFELGHWLRAELALESLLYRVPLEIVEAAGVLERARRALEHEADGGNRPLLYVAFPPRLEEYPSSSALRDVLATMASRPDLLREICYVVAPTCEEDAGGATAYRRLAPLAMRADRAVFERAALLAFSSLAGSGRYAELLEADWRTKGAVLGPLATRYLSELDRGQAPRKAAMTALRAEPAKASKRWWSGGRSGGAQ